MDEWRYNTWPAAVEAQRVSLQVVIRCVECTGYGIYQI